MGFDYLRCAHRGNIESLVGSELYSFDDKLFANVLFSLGVFGVHFSSLSKDLAATVLEHTPRRLSTMDSVQSSKAIYAYVTSFL